MSRFRIPLVSASGSNSFSGVTSPTDSQASSSDIQPFLASRADSGTGIPSPPESRHHTGIQPSSNLQALPSYSDTTRVISVQHYHDLSETLKFMTQELEKWQQISDFYRGVTVYIFTGIRPEWGDALFEAIDKGFGVRKTWDIQARTLSLKMPTQVHDFAQKWVINSVVDWKDDGIISKEEWEALNIGFGTTIKLPTSPFKKFQKEPDIYIVPYDDPGPEFLPPITFEVGWSESASQLENDVRILLEGGDGGIRFVVVIDWNLQKDGITVAGKVDVWSRGSDGKPVRKQSENIYPVPKLLRCQAQRLAFTLDDVFLTTLQAHQDPSTIVYFDIGKLREEAEKIFKKIDLQAA